MSVSSGNSGSSGNSKPAVVVIATVRCERVPKIPCVSVLCSALAGQMVFEGRAQVVLRAERRGRDVRRRHVAVLRRQSNGVFHGSAVGRPVRQHGSTAATGSEHDAHLHGTGAHYVG